MDIGVLGGLSSLRRPMIPLMIVFYALGLGWPVQSRRELIIANPGGTKFALCDNLWQGPIAIALKSACLKAPTLYAFLLPDHLVFVVNH